jgi:hypothetical protein
VARQSAKSGDTVENGDNLDNLLREFQSRNEYRSDPNYVIEPIDFSTTIPERFVKILRGTSLGLEDSETFIEEADTSEQPETHSGLILLAENYDRQSQQKLQRAKIFITSAGVLLFVAVILFSALAHYLWVGILLSVIAAGLLLWGRRSTAQADEKNKFASALVEPEENI